MKRFGLLLLFMIVGITGYSVVAWRQSTSSPQLESSVLPAASPSQQSVFGLVDQEIQLVSLATAGATFRMNWIELDARRVRVGINGNLASSSAELASRSGCVTLTSAAFYGADGEPLGLLISNSRELSSWRKNQLFNGIIGFDSSTDTVIVDQGEPTGMYLWAVQAGPLLWHDAAVVPLSLKTDQPARRILAALTTDGRLVVGVVVAEDSLFGGPKLAEMEAVITAWQTLSGFTFQSVLNLDGGTASAFLSDTLKLKELKPIGSYLCEKRLD